MAVSPRSYINWIRFFMDAYCFFSVSCAAARSAVTCSSWVFLSASSSSNIPILTKRLTSSASFASISLCRAACCRSRSSIFLFAAFKSSSAFFFAFFALLIVLASTVCIWANATADANITAKICTLLFLFISYLRLYVASAASKRNDLLVFLFKIQVSRSL